MFPDNPWFIRFKENKDATHRVFCFNYAGGNAYMFFPWAKLLGPSFEVIGVQMPGHGNRVGEPLLTTTDPIIAYLMDAIREYMDKPFIFFGHSLGGLIAYELTYAMQGKKLVLPTHLFISAKTPPHLINPNFTISNLPEKEFIDEVKKYNGLPDELLRNRELLNLIIPILRADFKILEEYHERSVNKLNCSLIALGGLLDEQVTPFKVREWSSYTTKSFQCKLFSGGHFFINKKGEEVTKLIKKISVRNINNLSHIKEGDY